MLNVFEGIRIKPVGWVKGGLYAMLIAGAYYSAFQWLIGHDWEKEDYNYCYLIPFLVLYLIWEKRERLAQFQSEPSWSGFIPLCVGILLFWLGELGGEYFTMYVSFWLIVVGLTWMHFGWQKIKEIYFAFIMMLAMFPLPDVLNVRISFGLKLISSKLGVWMLQLYGMSAYREGNVIDLGFTQLQVVDACSGLRYLYPLMVLSLLLSYWFKAHVWKRGILFLSSIPIAIVVNSLRIAVTGVLYGIWGAKVAEGFFHGFSGWLIFMFMIPVLLVEMWMLRKLPPVDANKCGSVEAESAEALKRECVDANKCGSAEAESGEREDGRGKSDEGRAKKQSKSEDGSTEDRDGRWKKGAGSVEASTSQPLNHSTTQPLYKSLLQPVFIVAVIMLGLTLILSNTVEFREKVPINKPFKEFPLQVGGWIGKHQDIEQKFLKELDLSDYIMVDYKNPQGNEVNFYVAYYESQRKGESIHSPETCLPGGGWTFNEAGATTITLSKSSPVQTQVNRAFMEKAGIRELTYYWFPQRGRILTNITQLKIYTFWDALTKQRTDGALVRVITPVYKSETLQDAEARLQGFVREIMPVLDEYIPGK